jgi:hypothetical protein
MHRELVVLPLFLERELVVLPLLLERELVVLPLPFEDERDCCTNDAAATSCNQNVAG